MYPGQARCRANPGLIYTTPLGSRAYDLIRARRDAPSENDDPPLFSETTFGNRYNRIPLPCEADFRTLTG